MQGFGFSRLFYYFFDNHLDYTNKKRTQHLFVLIFSVGLRQKPEMKIGKTACVPFGEQTRLPIIFHLDINFCRI